MGLRCDVRVYDGFFQRNGASRSPPRRIVIDRVLCIEIAGESLERRFDSAHLDLSLGASHLYSLRYRKGEAVKRFGFAVFLFALALISLGYSRHTEVVEVLKRGVPKSATAYFENLGEISLWEGIDLLNEVCDFIEEEYGIIIDREL